VAVLCVVVWQAQKQVLIEELDMERYVNLHKSLSHSQTLKHTTHLFLRLWDGQECFLGSPHPDSALPFWSV
jgi:hypothetical protein